MNALAEIPVVQTAIDTPLALPEGAPINDWIEAGRQLADRKRELDWHTAEWADFGLRNYPEQLEMALGELGVEMREVKRLHKTVEAFPPHLRDPGLTFEHHSHVADLPKQEALPLLRQAHTEHLPARKLRIMAMLKKVETGQTLPREDDAEYDALIACVRAWNRAGRSVREEFAEMIAESDFGVIEA